MSSQFICTHRQVAGGTTYWFYPPGCRPRTPVLLRFSGMAVVPATR